ncbi:hypothetical protein AcV7_006646 [Taiwanofungus camphoratus]|nr:hypothetical protein AcV7_006646 [Antrodia cinnamomea]
MRRVYERRQCSCLLIPFDLWSKIVVYQKVHSRNNCSLSGLWELQTWLRRPLEYSRLDRSSLGQRPSACAGILWKAGSFLLGVARPGAMLRWTHLQIESSVCHKRAEMPKRHAID